MAHSAFKPSLTKCSTGFAPLCFAHCCKELCTLRLSAIPFSVLSLTTCSRFWVSKNGRNGKYRVGLAIAQALQYNYPSRGIFHSRKTELVKYYWEPHMTDTWQLRASAEHSPYMPQSFSYCQNLFVIKKTSGSAQHALPGYQHWNSLQTHTFLITELSWNTQSKPALPDRINRITW